MKDLGCIHYFLSIQLPNTLAGIFLSQDKYIDDVSDKVSMSNHKPSLTPTVDPSSPTIVADALTLRNLTLFWLLVRSLQYITIV